MTVSVALVPVSGVSIVDGESELLNSSEEVDAGVVDSEVQPLMVHAKKTKMTHVRFMLLHWNGGSRGSSYPVH